MKVRHTPLLCFVALVLLTASHTTSTLPVYRIGIVLPLEGSYRPVGLDVFFATRAAILHALRSNSMQSYRVELAVYNDLGNPTYATNHARALANDESVLVVMGHWTTQTTQAAIPVYQTANLPIITTVGTAVHQPGKGIFVLDAPPAEREQRLNAYLENNIEADNSLTPTNNPFLAEIPSGEAIRSQILESDPSAIEPGQYAALAYDAVFVALDAIASAVESGVPDRSTVAEALARTEYDGLTGLIRFNDHGFRIDSPLYVYGESNTGAPELLARLP